MNKLVNKIICGDALTKLKELPDKSINMCMTSPPYWALRDYGTDVETIWDGDENCEHDFDLKEIQTGTQHWNQGGKVIPYKERKTHDGRLEKVGFCSKCGAWKGQLGLEPTFNLYISHLCDIFDEVKRVLRDDGTCWVNLGDTYYSVSGGKFLNDNISSSKKNITTGISKGNRLKKGKELEQKNLCNIPARFSIEMQNRGWILRNIIIWHKPNCMPSSVKDRFTVDFEYIFFFSKKKKYYFETQREPHKTESIQRTKYKWDGYRESGSSFSGMNIKKMCHPDGRNKRCVWNISTKSFKGAHFAVYPPELIEIPIKAGCPEFVCKRCGKARENIFKGKSSAAFNIRVRDVKKRRIKHTDRKASEEEVNDYEEKIYGGKGKRFIGYTDCGCGAEFESGIVLDPFFGAGTTGLVALKQNKNFVGIELNKKYIEIAKRRLKPFMK